MKLFGEATDQSNFGDTAKKTNVLHIPTVFSEWAEPSTECFQMVLKLSSHGKEALCNFYLFHFSHFREKSPGQSQSCHLY